MSVQRLLDEFLAERHALGFVANTDEHILRRFLKDFVEPETGEIEFTKEYVLNHVGHRPNVQTNTVLRDVCAINCFLDFVIRKGYTAYKIPQRSLPKEIRNFKAYIFTDDEIKRILNSADNIAFCEHNPFRHLQLPVMFRILFNCGLRISELLDLRRLDVNMDERVFTILDAKFHKNRLVPFSDAVAESLEVYLCNMPPATEDSYLFPSFSNENGRYGYSWIHNQFRFLLRLAHIPYGGKGKGPRPHDTRHTFAVHCLNNWVFSGEDLTSALPVLSRYLGHVGLSGTQKYLQLTAEMYPTVVREVESRFGSLIPAVEGANETV